MTEVKKGLEISTFVRRHYRQSPIFIFYFTIFPVKGILVFQPPGLGSYTMRATASYSYEGPIDYEGLINHGHFKTE